MLAYEKRFRCVCLCVIVLGVILIGATVAQAQLPSTVDEGSLAVSYNNIAGETGWGALGAVPFVQGSIKGHASAVAQKSATLLRSKYHAEVGTSLGSWDVNLYTNGLIKAYSGADAGRVSGVGLAIEAPERKVGEFDVTAGIGIEGSNAGQIGSPNAGDTLEALGYDTEVLEEKGLYGLNPAPTGLTIDQRNAFKALVYAELAHPSGLSISVKGLPEIASDSDGDPIHQLIVSGNTSIELGEQLSLELGADLGLQTFNDEIEREIATFAGIKLSF